MEKYRMLKEIGVHDIDHKSPVYGHPAFVSEMNRILPYQSEKEDFGKHWETGWHLVDNYKHEWDEKLDEGGMASIEGYMPLKESEDDIKYAKSIGRAPGWELAKKNRDDLSAQFKKEEAAREAAKAAAEAAEGGEEGKEGEGGEAKAEGKGEAKEEKKEEKKEAKLVQGDAEPTNFVVEPIADILHFNSEGTNQDMVGEFGYTMAQ